jgi:hypothetical protein
MAHENLSCNSEEAETSIADEIVAAQMFMEQFPQYTYQHTPKHKPAAVDAVLTENGLIVKVIETKCRYSFDLDTFDNKWHGRWLVSHDKIVRSMALAKSLHVGLTFFLYVAMDKTLLVQSITDSSGLIRVDFNVAATETLKNIFKEEYKVENNAYIDMSRALRIS